jgi:anthranilate/para-aminobenzoate synthase component I
VTAPARAPRAASKGALRGDAIALAAQWCAAARELPETPCVMAFGSRETALVLVGAERTLRLRRYAGEPLAEGLLWERLEEFCRPPSFVAGYVGFDAVWPDATRRPARNQREQTAPTLLFWEPSGVLRIDTPRSGRPGISVVQGHAALDRLRPRTLGAFEPVSPRRFDSEAKGFREAVARALAPIRSGEVERLTLARRVDLPDDLDLLASFATPPDASRCGVARSFYLATPGLELAGHSPELLASGNREGFVCYKLSGTGPRHPDAAADARLRVELIGDAKILSEHASSIAATHAALASVGAVTRAPMEVLERPGLRHLMTPRTPWSAVLRALLPCGAQPRAAGLACLDALERTSRGAYYGILGFRSPEGDFEFSQVLRTLFRDGTGVHALVGAAVTQGSSVDGETEETRLKLDDVVARRPQQSASTRSSTAGRPAITSSS